MCNLYDTINFINNSVLFNQDILFYFSQYYLLTTGEKGAMIIRLKNKNYDEISFAEYVPLSKLNFTYMIAVNHVSHYNPKSEFIIAYDIYDTTITKIVDCRNVMYLTIL